MPKAIGFTGVQFVPRSSALAALQNMLLEFRSQGFDEFHHGDCVGADAAAHKRAIRAGFVVHIHPPTDTSRRAFSEGAAYVHEPWKYLIRNRHIAKACDVLIAMPVDPNREVRRSGEWATVRYAREYGKRVVFIAAD